MMLEAEIYDVEVEGAKYGLCAAITHANELPEKPGIMVCLDNTAAIWYLQGTPSYTSQKAFRMFQEAADGYEGSIEIYWVPGYKGITGNEWADQLAKKGVREGEVCNDRPTYAYTKKLAKRK